MSRLIATAQNNTISFLQSEDITTVALATKSAAIAGAVLFSASYLVGLV